MFLKMTRMMYFDTLNSNMTIAQEVQKVVFELYFFLIYKKFGKYRVHHRCF